MIFLSITHIVLILLTGTVAGFLNVMAGGGSLLTLPMLIFLGLPSATANGTNKVALLIQNTTAIWNFRRKGFFDVKLGLMLAIPAMIGSIVGSQIAVSIPDELFNRLLAIVMFLVLLTLIKKPKKKTELREEEFTKKKKITGIITFFIIGVYGGFLQAGTGFLIISAFTLLTSMSLVRINSLKVFIIFFYTITSIGVFWLNGNIDWVLGLTLALGNSIGAYIGSNFAVAKGDKWIKKLVIIVVSIMAIKLLFNI